MLLSPSMGASLGGQVGQDRLRQKVVMQAMGLFQE